jgi:hypothetical protein
MSMVGDADNKDKDESRKIAIILVALVIALGIAVLLMLPVLADMVAVHFAPGLGLKTSAVIAFFTTVTIMVVFAVASGDGLLGEIQFILGGFFLFFIIIWLLLAWIF